MCGSLDDDVQKFYCKYTDLVGQYKDNACQTLVDPMSYNDSYFCRFAMDKLIQLAKIVGVMPEVDYAYSIRITW